MDPWIHGSVDLWIHGSMDPWIDGSMDPWIHLSMDPRKQLLRRYLFCCNTRDLFCCSTSAATHEISYVATQISCGATQEISSVATHEISCVATQEFEDLQDPVASQELILCFSATPEIAGNLPVGKKVAHINPEAPGASKVRKLERGVHFVQRNLIYASTWTKLFFPGRNLTVSTQTVCPKSIKNIMNGVPVAPFEIKLGQNESYGLREP